MDIHGKALLGVHSHMKTVASAQGCQQAPLGRHLAQTFRGERRASLFKQIVEALAQRVEIPFLVTQHASLDAGIKRGAAQACTAQ